MRGGAFHEDLYYRLVTVTLRERAMDIPLLAGGLLGTDFRSGAGLPVINVAGCPTHPGFEEPGHPFMETPKIAGIPSGLPIDIPTVWFVALAAPSKSATAKRVRENPRSDHPLIAPGIRKSGPK